MRGDTQKAIRRHSCSTLQPPLNAPNDRTYLAAGDRRTSPAAGR
jgi:hypothetical protein